MSLYSILVLGFFLGMRHATDADHVVAVTAIVSRERSLRAAAPIGAIWGLGHTATVLVVGGAIILLGIVVPTRLGLAMEFSVAILLILLGCLNVSSLWGRSAGGPVHDKSHETVAKLDSRFEGYAAYKLIRPLGVGVIHGLAGSAAVALLVLSTLNEPAWALGYLLVFGIGTIAGMLLITTALAVPFAFAAQRFQRMHRSLGVIAGALSVALGVFLVYEIGFVDGLFTSNPNWDPH